MFKLISFVLKFYPVVMVVIEIVEAYSTGKTGPEKKAIVLKVVREIAARFGLRMTEAHVNMISQIIDAIVATLNALGIFKHPPTEGSALEPAPVPVPAPVPAPSDDRLDELEAILAR